LPIGGDMINHIVMFNFRDDISEAERERLLKDLRHSFGRLPTVQNFRMGEAIQFSWKNRKPSFAYMFSMDFKNEAALKKYMDDHRQFSHDRFLPAIKEYLSQDTVIESSITSGFMIISLNP